MRGLEGKTYVVTGAGSGIGKGAAQHIAQAGGRVVLFDFNANGAGEVAKKIIAAGGDAYAMFCDVSDEESVQQCVGQVLDLYGTLDGVVTSAGINIEEDRNNLSDADAESFERVLAVNLTGTFLTIRYCMPSLVATEGAVVTIASTAGIRGHGEGWGYTASKGGVEIGRAHV